MAACEYNNIMVTYDGANNGAMAVYNKTLEQQVHNLQEFLGYTD